MSNPNPAMRSKLMNLPNKLTILRILLIPVCIMLIALKWHFPAAVVFAVASITDFLDGYLARRDNLVTNFGKFADPVADKLLVLTAMVMLTSQGMLPAWAVCILIIRELSVDGLRMVAAGKKNVVAASIWGKMKTTLQIICVLSALLHMPGWLTMIMTVLMTVATVFSGADYFIKLKDVFKEDVE